MRFYFWLLQDPSLINNLSYRYVVVLDATFQKDTIKILNFLKELYSKTTSE